MRNISIFLLCFVIIGALLISLVFLDLYDKKAYCLDIGKIYDPVQKICRDDCLTWSEEIGCVPITEENIEKKSKEGL